MDPFASTQAPAVADALLLLIRYAPLLRQVFVAVCTLVFVLFLARGVLHVVLRPLLTALSIASLATAAAAFAIYRFRPDVAALQTAMTDALGVLLGSLVPKVDL
jgi:hypothetical protein